MRTHAKRESAASCKILAIAVFAILISGALTKANAATNSNNTTIALSATVNTSLTVSLSGATQFWDTAHTNPLTPGSAANAGNAPITVTTRWVLGPAQTRVFLYAYFSSATGALNPVVGATKIPSSAFQIKVGAGAFNAVNQTNAGFGVAGSSRRLQTTNITNANRVSNATAVLSFNINLSTLPQLPADTYTGTLNIQAQTTP